ncbi:MAG: GNAT family N-acetyltransferase, partial [Bacteroidota bacterium]
APPIPLSVSPEGFGYLYQNRGIDMTIRNGTREDIPALHALIKELAVYEKAPQEVEVTLEELAQDGFGSDPQYAFFVAEWEGQVVGIALYYFKYSTWKGTCLYLEDLIVHDPYRGKGIGAALFEAVVRRSRDLGVRRMEWQVLDWNAPAIGFYKKYGAHLDAEWLNGKLVYDQLQQFQPGV